MRIAELEMHPADTADRREIAQDDFGLGLCNITKCCTEVCPENIKITDNALIPMKERVAGRSMTRWSGSAPRSAAGRGMTRPPSPVARRADCLRRSPSNSKYLVN